MKHLLGAPYHPLTRSKTSVMVWKQTMTEQRNDGTKSEEQDPV
ncbi:MAG: hypothetical protein ACJAXT_002183 [Paracoccaceae bacterium]|jgi:hypothetical protein